MRSFFRSLVRSFVRAFVRFDRNNLFGALEFAETAAGLGVQPIIGATLHIRDGEDSGDMALLVKNEAGYLNLMALISAAHLESDGKEGPGVSMDDIAGRPTK